MYLPELVGEIIKYVPKNNNLSLILVNKLFSSFIKVDENQESIGINGDLFSLRKIPYCPEVVLISAIRNNQFEMIDYLTNKHKFDEEYYQISVAIGFSGNEKLMHKCFRGTFGTFGACEALRPFDKNSTICQGLVCYAYKFNNNSYIEAVNLVKGSLLEAEYFELMKIKGVCAGQDLIKINEIIKNNQSSPEINFAIDGLIEGQHFELVKKYAKVNTVDCIDEELVIKNNYELVEYLVKEKITTYCEDYTALLMIDFRRIDMLKLVLEHFLELLDKNVLLARAKELNFQAEFDLINTF